MAIGDPVQGRVDVPGGAAGGCWRLVVSPGELRIAVNFDQPDQLEKPALRITDDIGRTLSRTGIGSLGSGATLTHHFTARQSIIVELTASGGSSHFGMRADSAPGEPAPPDDLGITRDAGVDEGPRGPAPRRDRGVSRVEDLDPPDAGRPACPTHAIVRIIPSGERAVRLTVRLPDGVEETIDWSGPIEIVDAGAVIGRGRLEGHESGRAEVTARGLTAFRAKGAAVRFACDTP